MVPSDSGGFFSGGGSFFLQESHFALRCSDDSVVASFAYEWFQFFHEAESSTVSLNGVSSIVCGESVSVFT